MRSALDDAISNKLVGCLPSVAPEEECSLIYKRAADIATRLAIDHAFRERLISQDAATLGCSRDGKLTRAGRRLSALTFEEYSRVEARTETTIHAKASLHAAKLFWIFTADESTAQFTLRRTGRADQYPMLGNAPDIELISVRARREAGEHQVIVEHIFASTPGLNSLDRRFIGSGLDAAELCHCLIGLLPECYAEDWDIYEKIVDCVLRYRDRGRKRTALAGRWWKRRDRWWIRRLKG